MKTFIIRFDPMNFYQNGEEITAQQLINDYIECANEIEDADTIGWLQTLLDRNEDNDLNIAVDWVAEAWDLDVEEKKS